jgi:hypothetical protein
LGKVQPGKREKSLSGSHGQDQFSEGDPMKPVKRLGKQNPLFQLVNHSGAA